VAVFGVLSLVVWAIILVVAIKYVVFVMRADNGGEGGTMALLSLVLPVAGPLQSGLLIVRLAGASLFFGDAMITSAGIVTSAFFTYRPRQTSLGPHELNNNLRVRRSERNCLKSVYTERT